ncbi:hypothetical protein PR048_028884 [Dryococelus australis]|uniref:U1-type domain-containing protein n=1 Tax=Dryococelus australis TaxID=614101 RepID=A0ABQ9GBS9_9NEOP|nr:hypothetical protein PR048_028884 [Dryococelus australis]
MTSDAKPGCFSSDTSVPAKKRKYLQKIPDISGWLFKSTKGERYAYCKACMCDLAVSAAGKVDIEKHSKGSKHLTSITSLSKQRTLLDMPS